MRALIPVLACLLLVTPTLAAEPAKATAADIAAARAEADRLIADAGAGDLFTNITDSARPTVRNTASGLVCNFAPGAPENAILLFKRREEDVGCRTTRRGQSVLVFATRFPADFTAENARDGAVKAIEARYANVTPYSGPVIQMSSKDLPQIYAARLYGEVEGKRWYLEVQTAERDGWNYKLRMSAPADEATDAQLEAAAIMTLLLMRVDKTPGGKR